MLPRIPSLTSRWHHLHYQNVKTCSHRGLNSCRVWATNDVQLSYIISLGNHWPDLTILYQECTNLAWCTRDIHFQNMSVSSWVKTSLMVIYIGRGEGGYFRLVPRLLSNFWTSNHKSWVGHGKYMHGQLHKETQSWVGPGTKFRYNGIAPIQTALGPK